MRKNQKSEVIVITGASAGVWRAAARAFARRGCAIGLIARGTDGLEGAKRDVEELGGRALILPADVADAHSVERAAEEVERHFGPIDVWVNNAMVSVFSPFLEMTPREYQRVTEVTYLGYVYGTMAALRRMAARDRGTIVQVGSALAYRSIPLQSAYCGAKHAICGFTDSLRSELIHRNSRVHLTMLLLPAVNTPQFSWVKSRLPGKPQPVPPIYQPEVIAEAIYWAAHHKRRELVVGGSTAGILFLNKLFPGAGDLYLGETGYASQQSGEAANPNRPNNLWNPVPGDRGARGEFSDRARGHSLQLWSTIHRDIWLSMLAGIVLGLGLRRLSEGAEGRSDHDAVAA